MLLLSVMSSGTVAFCLVPLEASVDVIPWVPTPQQHAILFIKDTVGGSTCSPYGQLANVQVTQQGNVITIHADVIGGPDTSQVDLGVLAPGTYTVNYSSTMSTSGQYWHEASMDFSVSPQGYADAVEYFAPSLGHYFMTSDSTEIQALDNGVIPGWSRTGESFHVIPASTRPTTALSVCRFYGLPPAGLNSHFFTASQTECAAVQRLWPTAWLLETTDAFAVPATGAGDGEPCAQGSIPLYRLYNNRADANHRFTISTSVRDQMVAMGWILEGFRGPLTTGNNIYVMCVPQ